MADPKKPTLLTVAPSPLLRPPMPPIRSFVVLPELNLLLTFQGTDWITRHLSNGRPHETIAPSPFNATESIWTDRLRSPDGQWMIALDGQTSIEYRSHDQFDQRRMLDWPTGIPKGFGYWAGRPDWLLALLGNGVTELWELPSQRRLAHSPALVEGDQSRTHWPPEQFNRASRLELSPGRAMLCAADRGPLGELRPTGRWPLIGGAIHAQGAHALLVTGTPPTAPLVDGFAGGEILFFATATGQLAGACTHSVLGSAGTRATALPTLSHVLIQTPTGGLACLESQSGRIAWELGMGHAPSAVAFSPDGQRLLMGFTSGEVALMGDLQAAPLRLRAHEFQVAQAALSPDGRRGVSVGAEGSVVVWDAITGQPVAGAPGRYDRTRDPLALLTHPQAPGEVQARLGAPATGAAAGANAFCLDFNGTQFRLSFHDLAQSSTVHQGPANRTPEGTGFVLFQPSAEQKKKNAQTMDICILDAESGGIQRVGGFENVPNPPSALLYLNPTRLVLATGSGEITLWRLNKTFGAHVKLEFRRSADSPWRFFPAVDGSAFAVCQGADVLLFAAEDGKSLGRLDVAAANKAAGGPGEASTPSVTAAWMAPMARTVRLVMDNGSIQAWTLP